MENRKLLTVDEAQTLASVQWVYNRFVDRAQLGGLRDNPNCFWGAARSE